MVQYCCATLQQHHFAKGIYFAKGMNSSLLGRASTVVAAAAVVVKNIAFVFVVGFFGVFLFLQL